MEKDEITLKEIILKIGTYFDYVKSKWKVLAVLGFVVGAVMGVMSFLEPKTYPEQLTFMMDDSNGGGQNGSLQVLGNLFGGKKSANNLDKVLRLFESKQIIHSTLFDSTMIDGKKDYLANHFFDKYGIENLVNNYVSLGFLYKQAWVEQLLDQPDFRFKHKDLDKFSNLENLYLRLLYQYIMGNESIGMDAHLSSSLDENSGIMTLRMSSENPELTLGVLNNIYHHLSQFFIEKSTEKYQRTYDITEFKRDSILTELKASEYRLANFKDRNRSLVTVKGYLDQLKYERNVSILNIMYASAVRNLETTDFSLRNMTPVVQVIDLPRSPIYPVKSSWLMSFIQGGIFGVVIGVIIFVFRKVLKDIFEEN
jgi:hypothetical protein